MNEKHNDALGRSELVPEKVELRRLLHTTRRRIAVS
jgi:hypothetical protein